MLRTLINENVTGDHGFDTVIFIRHIAVLVRSWIELRDQAQIIKSLSYAVNNSIQGSLSTNQRWIHLPSCIFLLFLLGAGLIIWCYIRYPWEVCQQYGASPAILFFCVWVITNKFLVRWIPAFKEHDNCGLLAAYWSFSLQSPDLENRGSGCCYQALGSIVLFSISSIIEYSEKSTKALYRKCN